MFALLLFFMIAFEKSKNEVVGFILVVQLGKNKFSTVDLV